MPARRLKSFATIGDREKFDRLADFIGRELVISDAKIVQGKKGPYAIFTATDGDGVVHKFSCGGYRVLDALSSCIAQGGFPVEAVFAKDGPAWTIE